MTSYYSHLIKIFIFVLIEVNRALPVRFSNGQHRAGNVQVYTNNRWIPVCNRNFGRREAVVICRQLGFTNVSRRLLGSTLPNTTNYLVNLNCTGREFSLRQCSYNIGNNNSCSQYNTVVIECIGNDNL